MWHLYLKMFYTRYVEYKILDKIVFLDGKTGIFSFDRKLFDELLTKSTFDFDSFKPNYSEYKTTSATFCINLSDECNLACDYCFNPNKQNKNVSERDAIAFLSLCFNHFPEKEKYFVDLSGKGEPLLFLNEILKIKKYCDDKSNEIKKEILVQFVCNGVLLDSLTASILQKHGILFGVSLDGNEYIHNKHRKTKAGKSTYQIILKNVNAIPHHEYVGVACTLTNDVFSLKQSLIELSKTFNTVSYKPSRGCDFAIQERTIYEWIKSYDELVGFLTEQTIRGNLKYIRILLNGEDYLGKYIRYIVLGQRNIIRCDAGLSRFTLDGNKNIYACPASFGFNKLKVGTIDHVSKDKSSKIFRKQINKKGCIKCDFRNICGGECQVEKILSKGINKTMCKYKKHLILLAMYFTNQIIECNKMAYKEIYDFCVEIDCRKKQDSNLMIFLNKHPDYSFVEGKVIYDKRIKKY